MRALMLKQIGLVEVVDLSDPRPAAGEVIVEVAAAGVCGSDLHSARNGGLLRTPPLIMGHELAGTVAGRRVAVHPFISCGRCDLCDAGHDQLCRNRVIIGIQRAGGFAERVAVPESGLVDLPSTVSLEAGALVEPMAVALHAVRLCPPLAGSRIGIIGAGAIGLLALTLCAAAADVTAVADLDVSRCARAHTLGATRTGAQLDGEFDVIIDAVGTGVTHAASLRHLRPAGTVIWVGNESPAPSFDAQALVRAGHRVLGSAAYTRREFEEAARLVDDDMLEWVATIPLEKAAAVFEDRLPAPSSKSPTEVGGPVKTLICP